MVRRPFQTMSVPIHEGKGRESHALDPQDSQLAGQSEHSFSAGILDLRQSGSWYTPRKFSKILLGMSKLGLPEIGPYKMIPAHVSWPTQHDGTIGPKPADRTPVWIGIPNEKGGGPVSDSITQRGGTV